MKVGDPPAHSILKVIMLDVLVFQEYYLSNEGHLVLIILASHSCRVLGRINNYLFALISATPTCLLVLTELLIIAACSRVADHAESKGSIFLLIALLPIYKIFKLIIR